MFEALYLENRASGNRSWENRVRWVSVNGPPNKTDNCGSNNHAMDDVACP